MLAGLFRVVLGINRLKGKPLTISGGLNDELSKKDTSGRR